MSPSISTTMWRLIHYANRTEGLSPLAQPYKLSSVQQDIFLQFSFNTNHVLCSCTAAAAAGCWLWWGFMRKHPTHKETDWFIVEVAHLWPKASILYRCELWTAYSARVSDYPTWSTSDHQLSGLLFCWYLLHSLDQTTWRTRTGMDWIYWEWEQ